MEAGETDLHTKVLAGRGEVDDLGEGIHLHHLGPVQPLKVLAAHSSSSFAVLPLLLLSFGWAARTGGLEDGREARGQSGLVVGLHGSPRGS